MPNDIRLHTNQPLWKLLLSYFGEIRLESASSEYNPQLFVSLRNGRYQLCTARAVYSYDDLYDNFARAFRQIQIEKMPVENVLVLGLGLASIPFLLEKKFHRRYHYTIVEIDEVVIGLAHKYVLHELDSPLQIICADASVFVEICQEKFDLICMDIFLDDAIPEIFEEESFLFQLNRLLAPQGILLFNKLAARNKDRHQARDFFENRFRPVFPQSTILDVGGNWMLLNRPVRP